MDLRDITEFFRDAFKYLIVILVVFLIALFVFSFQQVVGPSMSDTLKEDDVLIVNKLVYKIRDVRRSEIVVIKQDSKYMIKRVIGLPGETVSYKDGKLYINGEVYKDNYAKSETKDFDLSKFEYDKIPENTYFVMGDNRANSQDSRDFGVVKKDDIVGMANFRIYPFGKFGSVN